MHLKLDFEGNSEISAYICLTNAYAIVGRSNTPNFIETLRENLDIPIVETTVGNIKTVGNLLVGNKHGLICSDLINDQELLHIRNSLPPEIRVVRVYDKLNALGNSILCNDNLCLVNPDFGACDILEDVLKVPVHKFTLGTEPLVGSYGVMSSRGILLHPQMNKAEVEEISRGFKLDAIGSTINHGKNCVGSGIVTNDYICIVGKNTTNVEIKVAEKVLGLSNNDLDENVVVEDVVY